MTKNGARVSRAVSELKYARIEARRGTSLRYYKRVVARTFRRSERNVVAEGME